MDTVCIGSRNPGKPKQLLINNVVGKEEAEAKADYKKN